MRADSKETRCSSAHGLLFVPHETSLRECLRSSSCHLCRICSCVQRGNMHVMGMKIHMLQHPFDHVRSRDIDKRVARHDAHTPVRSHRFDILGLVCVRLSKCAWTNQFERNWSRAVMS